jgi:hypothetical protein
MNIAWALHRRCNDCDIAFNLDLQTAGLLRAPDETWIARHHSDGLAIGRDTDGYWDNDGVTGVIAAR